MFNKYSIYMQETDHSTTIIHNDKKFAIYYSLIIYS